MKKKVSKVLNIVLWTVLVLMVFLGILLVQVGKWVPATFGNIPFEEILYHLMSPLEGTDTSYVSDFIRTCLPAPIVFTVCFLCFVLFIHKNKKKNLEEGTYSRRKNAFIVCASSIGCMICCFLGAYNCSAQIRLDEYLYNLKHPSNIFEQYYVNPENVTYSFPETKRNLIYIFLESMEQTYEDKEHGGAMEESLIPELQSIQENNLTFGTNGFIAPSLNGFTAGAMIGETSGIPIKTSVNGNEFIKEDNYLAGAYSIGDILAQNGYHNELMIGSDAVFGGRKYYFEQHGNYEIVDYGSAIVNGWIPSDYRVWWGYEDIKLFDFAKIELEKLSSQNEPFNFTMLTVDTHFTGGYICDECENIYDDQYSNVLRCSSKQVAEFIAWAQQQPWYENTTIVLAGDHNCMDTTWFQDIEASGYVRKEYYTIINSPIAVQQNKTRELCTYDLFPTTLASLGVTFDSPRLGFGTNLYLDTPTLVELMGIDTFNSELSKQSAYYDNYILR
ncbi:LTA synthase family protein [Floccifex sp.]|uniref:LTA synthase family protein n=1 Tax=Floccifex sp. TaxID=2815810 RepID=UPI002A754ED7|nr:LTA synthase family protein [Floccifex sp.]MDD7281284.1 LTA synthase family protein [Erysipelotrichaceae bacterium]MDY2957841.1 LTA synthase family protein [Floccifex sp.]